MLKILKTLTIITILLSLTFTISGQDTSEIFLNPDDAPASIQNDFEFSEQYGAYVREENDSKIAYRRYLDSPQISGASDGETIIMSEIEHPELGTITFEQDFYTDGLHISQRPQLYFTDVANEFIPAGLREYFLLSYQKIYEISEEEAEEYLADNVELPLSWQLEFTQYGVPGMALSRANSEVRYIRPQSGVSFVFIDQLFMLNQLHSEQRYPRLAVTFIYASGIPGYTFGLDAEPNGRLVMYSYSDYTAYYSQLPEPGPIYALTVGGRLRSVTLDAYKFTHDIKENWTRLNFISFHHTGSTGNPVPVSDQIKAAYGSPSDEEILEFSERENLFDLPESERAELIQNTYPNTVFLDITLP